MFVFEIQSFSADSELLISFREESIEGRTPYLGRAARGGLLQREG